MKAGQASYFIFTPNSKRLLSLTLFRPGFFQPSETGGGAIPPLCNFKTAYAMATKFAQHSVHTNSNHCKYCDVTVT